MYTDIKEFINEIPTRRIREHAEDLIQASNPVQRFWDFLKRHPDPDKQWDIYYDEHEMERVAAWLAKEGLVVKETE